MLINGGFGELRAGTEVRSDSDVLSMEKMLRSVAGEKQSYCLKVKH